jgi:hypothetical protein
MLLESEFSVGGVDVDVGGLDDVSSVVFINISSAYDSMLSYSSLIVWSKLFVNVLFAVYTISLSHMF